MHIKLGFNSLKLALHNKKGRYTRTKYPVIHEEGKIFKDIN